MPPLRLLRRFYLPACRRCVAGQHRHNPDGAAAPLSGQVPSANVVSENKVRYDGASRDLPGSISRLLVRLLHVSAGIRLDRSSSNFIWLESQPELAGGGLDAERKGGA